MIRVVPGRAAVAVGYMLLLLFVSSLPGREVARLGLSMFLLNLAHVPLFAGLAWVTVSAFVGPARTRVLLTAVICLAFAVMDEWYQTSVPGRVAALGDVATDAAGIALGIALREGLRPVVLAWKGDPQR
jgi:hypothetical protein